ncbi:MAG: S-layer homology domain-containing protein, partial [Clostridia bacterium]|nr:S-layer homology domain-containing protein [Clostridia bacterium]
MKKFMKSAVALFLACLLLIPGGFVFAAEPIDFADVDADDWFAPYVDYCSKYGLVNGMTATTFEPNTSLSR